MSLPHENPVMSQSLPGIPKYSQGKVREIFDLGEELLMVATDRISAFDVVLPNAIPMKGKVLTQLSAFWFDQLEGIADHHLLTVRVEEFPSSLNPFREQLAGRSMLVRKCSPLPIECVVRGYLEGSGWKEYQENGQVCGIELPPGLRQAEELSEPIFTPTTKASTGHDQSITFAQAVEIVGSDLAEQIRHLSLRIYNFARDYAAGRGIIICDTKFEFGTQDSQLLLIDEVLTPDSSRFWPASEHEPGRSQTSFDKQYIREFLETLDWDKKPPGPQLPEAVIEATSRRYLDAYRLLTGRKLEEAS